VFPGAHRSPGHPHESSSRIIAPLVILSLFALAFGGIAKRLGILEYLDPGFKAPEESSLVMMIGLGLALGGVLTGYLIYGLKPLTVDVPDALTRPLGPLYRFLQNRACIDELYDCTVVRLWVELAALTAGVEFALQAATGFVVAGTREISRNLAFNTDRILIDQWSFDGLCKVVRGGGFLSTRGQTGQLQDYLRCIALGAVLLGWLTWWTLARG